MALDDNLSTNSIEDFIAGASAGLRYGQPVVFRGRVRPGDDRAWDEPIVFQGTVPPGYGRRWDEPIILHGSVRPEAYEERYS